jgi:hypothetical protein
MLLQNFCALDLFALTMWKGSQTDVYVPVIENLETAVLDARAAMIEKELTPDPKTYPQRPFVCATTPSNEPPTRRTTRSATAKSKQPGKNARQLAKEEIGDQEAEDDSFTLDDGDEKEPSHKKVHWDSEGEKEVPPRRQASKVPPFLWLLFLRWRPYLSLCSVRDRKCQQRAELGQAPMVRQEQGS